MIKNKYLRHAVYFIIFSFLGWIFEVLIRGKIFFEHFLSHIFHINFPFLPIYGFGGILLLFIAKNLEKKIIPFYLRGLVYGSILIIFEFTSGVASLLVLKTIFWDYSAHFWNFLGITSLKVSLFWILVGYIFDYFYERRRKKLMKHFNR